MLEHSLFAIFEQSHNAHDEQMMGTMQGDGARCCSWNPVRSLSSRCQAVDASAAMLALVMRTPVLFRCAAYAFALILTLMIVYVLQLQHIGTCIAQAICDFMLLPCHLPVHHRSRCLLMRILPY